MLFSHKNTFFKSRIILSFKINVPRHSNQFLYPKKSPILIFSSFLANYSSNLSRVNEEPRNNKKKEESTTNGKTPVDKTPSTGSNVLPSSFKASVRKNGPNTNNGISSTAALNTNSKGPKGKFYEKFFESTIKNIWNEPYSLN